MGNKSLSWQHGILKHEKARFALVGVINTVVDFAIFLTLAKLIGLPAVIANVVSTSCALAVSYLLNKKAVFGNTDANNHRQIMQFILVTLTGLWVLQAIVITVVSGLIGALLSSTLLLVVAKAAATVVSLTWNYLWYSRVVFRKGRA